MLEAARSLFIEQGYAATTMAEVAAAAGVAVQTLYYSFRTKGQLLIALVQYLASGDIEAAPMSEPAWMRDALAAGSGVHVLELMIEHGTDIYHNVAEIASAVDEALGDPHVGQFWEGIARQRRAGMAALMGRVAALGELALPLERATDIAFVLASHETYRGLVISARWSERDYRSWILALLKDQLLA
jgi:AcrR family transcriptional regulator